MLANFAQFLWNWLSSLFNSFATFVGNIISGLGNAISKMFQWLGSILSQLFQWLGGLLHDLFQHLLSGITSFLKWLFHPFWVLITAFYFFISELVQVLIDILKIMFQVVHVLFAIAFGLLRTLSGLTYNQSAPAAPSDVMSPFSHMSTVFGALQLDNLAYVLRFGVWFMIAYAAIKIVGNWGIQ